MCVWQDLSPGGIPDHFVLTLSIFSYVGLSASILCLSIFLFTYFRVRYVRIVLMFAGKAIIKASPICIRVENYAQASTVKYSSTSALPYLGSTSSS